MRVWWVGLAAAVAALVVLVPAASAANLAPNPGFENQCGGPPCGWNASDGSTTAVWDSTTANSGNASVRVSGSFQNSGVTSDCIPITSTGMYSVSYAYRALSDATAPSSVSAFLTFYTDGSCTAGASGNGTVFNAITADGAWHAAPLETITVPSGTQSVTLTLQFQCGPVGTVGCPAPSARTVWFDDADLEPPAPTAVVVGSFHAKPAKSVRFGWRAVARSLPARIHASR